MKFLYLQVVPTQHSPGALPPKPLAGTVDFHCTEITRSSAGTLSTLQPAEPLAFAPRRSRDAVSSRVGPVLSAALPRVPVSQPGFPSLPTGARQRGIQTLISHLKHSREGSSLGPTFPPTIVFSSFPFPLAGCHTTLTILASAFPPPICRSSSSSTRHPPCPRGCSHPFVVVLLSVRLTQASLLGLRARASSSLQGVSPGRGDPQMPRDWRVHSGAHLAVSPSTPASSAARPPLFSVSVGVFLN